MAAWTEPSDDAPLFRVGGHPIYVTGLLTILYCAAWVAIAVSSASDSTAWTGQLCLSTRDVLHDGKAWQLLTHPLMNELSFWFAVNMCVFYFIGREVERAMGRRSYLLLYLGLILVPALFLLGDSLVTHSNIFYRGSSNVNLALFVAFALLFPDAPFFFFALTPKWIAGIFVAIQSLLYLAGHAWPYLAALWVGVAVAAVAIRVPFVSEFFEWMEERRERHRTEAVERKAVEKKQLEDRRNESIDPILDKISREGMQSLTKDERLRLEQARLELLQRDQQK